MIDLNKATAEHPDAIEQLRGNGLKIVSYRQKRGRFDEVRQLEEVPGLAGKWDGRGGVVADRLSAEPEGRFALLWRERLPSGATPTAAAGCHPLELEIVGESTERTC